MNEKTTTPQEEALQQIQHIAHDGLLDFPPSMSIHEVRKALTAKLERINNIAEGQHPDEDWRPLREDTDVIYAAQVAYRTDGLYLFRDPADRDAFAEAVVENEGIVLRDQKVVNTTATTKRLLACERDGEE